MIDGRDIVAVLNQLGVTDVVWLPDSDIGRWESAFQDAAGLRLLRVAREGEAMALAAGLYLGGRRPVVMVQCTGFFEAGDSFRNVVHDLRLPLFVLVGVRSYRDYRHGRSRDTCPVFCEPIIQAWKIPYRWLDPEADSPPGMGWKEVLVNFYRDTCGAGKPGVVLLVE